MKTYLFTSPRLGFREWNTEDIPSFIAINRDPAVMAYFPALLSPEETQRFVERTQKHFAEKAYCFYAVDLLVNKEFIGFIGFSTPRFEAFFTPCVEIGWRLKKEVWNQGYATEGAQRCLEYGFSDLSFKEIYSFTATINHRSERIMQKIGMQKVGEFDHPLLENGSPLCRHVLYKILSKELLPNTYF